jgi:TatA/E family protein of Tat protein translocase
MFNLFRNIGTTEILVIVLVLVIFFGSKRMSQLAKTAGESAKELKKAKGEIDSPLLNEDTNKDNNSQNSGTNSEQELKGGVK